MDVLSLSERAVPVLNTSQFDCWIYLFHVEDLVNRCTGSWPSISQHAVQNRPSESSHVARLRQCQISANPLTGLSINTTTMCGDSLYLDNEITNRHPSPPEALMG